MPQSAWTITRGEGPLVATAIHDGHALRDELQPLVALDEAQRLREEDPCTAGWTQCAATRVVGHRSRFEVDLNRPAEKAVYRMPEDAWGLHVWKTPLADDVVARSLDLHTRFYAEVRALLDSLADRHGHVVVYDLHTYNHRRQGPDGPAADAHQNPQVNLGTASINRELWGPLVERFAADLRGFDFPGGPLDVRENVKFQGGNFPRWIHATFPDRVCAIAIEFKKFFMDEWTGQPQPQTVAAIGQALRHTTSGVVDELQRLQDAGDGA